MPKYYVRVPITGYLTVEVEAESTEEAIELALEEAPNVDEIDEWCFCDRVVTEDGLFNGILFQAEVD